MSYDKVKYNTEYNKMNYTEMRFRVLKNEKPVIDAHWKNKGYTSFSAYMKDLIRKDMNESAEDTNVQVNNSKGFIIGNNGTINMK